MKTPSPPPLNLVALNLSDQSRAALDMALRGPGGGWCRLSDADSAQVAILDADAVGALTLYDQHRHRHPGRPLLVISVRDVHLKDILLLKKPVRVAELMVALSQARDRIGAPAGPAAAAAPPPSPTPAVPPPRTQTRAATRAMDADAGVELCGQAPDLDPADPRSREQLFYDPELYLQGRLQQALAEARHRNTALVLPLPQHRLVLLPATRRCHTDLSDRQLRGLCLLPNLDRPAGQWLSEDEARRLDAGGGPGTPLDTLLWKVALWTAHGRLPKGSDPGQRVALRHWPNFTRLPVPPHALRIAALWSRSPCVLADTPRLLAIPQRYVFAFYSACRALELLEITAPPTVPDTAPPVPAPARGLLRRILAVLRRAT